MSIRQNSLPDFRNPATLLRIVLAVHLVVLVVAWCLAPTFHRVVDVWIGLIMWVEPPLLVCLVVFWLARDLLWRLPRDWSWSVVVAGSVFFAVIFQDIWRFLGLSEGTWFVFIRAIVFSGLMAMILLEYFRLREGNLPRAVHEARVEALAARIRPHFLFNSLNTVLGLIRTEPMKAEKALEGLSDLFRALLREPRDLVPLSDEISLAREYLELESLRLGERLTVSWEIAEIPVDQRVPSLMLQVLLENAVRHGIEPCDEGGRVFVRLGVAGDRLSIEVENPQPARPAQQEGHRMGLANLRERLALHYDWEAELKVEVHSGVFHVRILIPGGRGH